MRDEYRTRVAGSSVIALDVGQPAFPSTVFVAPGAAVVGNVTIGDWSSVWYGAVIRADIGRIVIGRRTSVQDNVTLHAAAELVIGDDVTIGHNAVVHGAVVHSGALIGMGSVVMERAVISELSVVAAGSVILPGMVVPPGVMAAGNPATLKGDLSSVELLRRRRGGGAYAELAKRHMEMLREHGR